SSLCRLGAGMKGGVIAGEVDLARERRYAVPEATIDPLVRGPQGSEWLAPLADVVQLLPHQTSEYTPAAMGPPHSDDGAPGWGPAPSRKGEIQGERAGAADDVPAGPRGVRPSGLEEPGDPHCGLVGRAPEVVPDRGERRQDLVRLAGPDLDGHQTFS